MPAGRAFGEIELPSSADSMMANLPPPPPRPVSDGPPGGAHGAFGEIDLPREAKAPSLGPPGMVRTPPVADSANFGDLNFDKPA